MEDFFVYEIREPSDEFTTEYPSIYYKGYGEIKSKKLCNFETKLRLKGDKEVKESKESGPLPKPEFMEEIGKLYPYM